MSENKLKLELHIKRKKISLQLKNDDEIIDEMSWTDENDLSEKLLPAYDELIKRNSITSNDIEDYDIVTDEPAGFTTTRIAKTVISTLNYFKKGD